MNLYAKDADLPNDHLNWNIESANTNLNADFDNATKALTLSAPGFIGVVTLRCTITDDSSASAIDSFYVKVDEPVGLEDINQAIPVAYALDQNYPNPFNPLTSIKFALPKSGHVKIEIYNILGQRVMTLFDGNKEAGYHIVKFNAGGLASGLYFYRLESKGYSAIKKMILMK